jgi:hypothetical protein
MKPLRLSIDCSIMKLSGVAMAINKRLICHMTGFCASQCTNILQGNFILKHLYPRKLEFKPPSSQNG